MTVEQNRRFLSIGYITSALIALGTTQGFYHDAAMTDALERRDMVLPITCVGFLTLTVKASSCVQGFGIE